MKTAIEWLIEQLKINNYLSYNAHWLIDEAKEIEKQQVQTAYFRGELDYVKTAVEWLFFMMNNPNTDQDFANKLLEKAKEMEKEQRNEAFKKGQESTMKIS